MLEKFDFVECGFGVFWCWFDDFEGDVMVYFVGDWGCRWVLKLGNKMGDLFGVFCELDCWEMFLVEFLVDDIFVVGKGVVNVDWVVVVFDIVFLVFFVFGYDGMRERRIVWICVWYGVCCDER